MLMCIDISHTICSTYFFISTPHMKKQCIDCRIQNCSLPEDADIADCPVRKCLHIMGKKRSMIILLVLEKPHRFGELKKKILDITEKVLIMELRSLENVGYITRDVIQGKILNTTYTITPLGLKVLDVVESIAQIGKNMKI